MGTFMNISIGINLILIVEICKNINTISAQDRCNLTIYILGMRFIGNDFKCRPLIKNTQRNILLQQVVPLLHKPINAGSIVTFNIIKNLGNKTS